MSSASNGACELCGWFDPSGMVIINAETLATTYRQLDQYGGRIARLEPVALTVVLLCAGCWAWLYVAALGRRGAPVPVTSQ